LYAILEDIEERNLDLNLDEDELSKETENLLLMFNVRDWIVS
jgi:hypothetical protein